MWSKNISILHNLRTIIGELDDSTYTATHEAFYPSSLGAHTRHILDHYLMLLAGAAAGEVDYDRRNRDPEIETNRDPRQSHYWPHYRWSEATSRHRNSDKVHHQRLC